MDFPVYAVKNLKEFNRLSKKIGVRVHADLDEEELTASASRWGLKHLLAFRLLTHPEETFLLAGEHKHCPVCGNTNFEVLDDVWKNVLTADCSLDLKGSKDSELLKRPGGFFWVALARAVRAEILLETESDNPMSEAREHFKRERRPPIRNEYVDSTKLVIGSSPPLSQATQASGSSQSSGSEFQADHNEIDEDEHDARRSKPEDVTLHLVHSFLQHALNLCLVQDSATATEVRTRIERRKCTARVANKHTFSAVDDGGICEMRWGRDGWEMKHPAIALFETKKAFKTMEFDEQTGQYKPVVSNETLAQYLGEALATWKTDQYVHDQGVFVIAATSTFIRFVRYEFGPEYAGYIDAEDKRTQEALLAEHPDTFAYMHSTQWLNLQTSEGRKSALCHTLALLRWRNARRDELSAESEVSNDSMSVGKDYTLDGSMGVEDGHTYNESKDTETDYSSNESIDMDYEVDEADDASDG